MTEALLYDRSCTRCELHKVAKSVCIPGDGPLDAEILVVAQNPGVGEDHAGKILVGQSGKLLRSVLEENQLVARLENVVNCWTPENRKPTRVEMDACSHWLLLRVNAMPNLRYVIALGEVPLRALGLKDAVTSIAGVPRKVTAWGRELTVFPVLHPAAILRRRTMWSTWMSHFHQIREVIHPRPVSFAATVNAHLMPEGGFRLREVTETIAVDTETTSVDPARGSLLSVAVSDGRGTTAWWIETPDDLDAAERLLGGVGGSQGELSVTGEPDGRRDGLPPPHRRIVHHVPMEGLWASEFFGVEKALLPKLFRDTALLAYRVDPGQPMKLASVAARHLPEFSGWKMETEALLTDAPSMLELPKDEVLRRNAVDAFVTKKIHDILWEKLSPEEQALHEEDVAISLLNARMARRGMLLDEARLIAKRKELLHVQAEAQARAASLAGEAGHNPGSSRDVGRVLESWGRADPRKTPSGAPSTDEVTLRLLRHDEVDPRRQGYLDSVLAYRKAQKILGTYVTGYAQARDADGRVRSRLFWPGTVTWRPASYEPNLLNVPRKGVRDLFTAPLGMAFMEVDLAQAELRVSAALSRDPLLLTAFRTGMDLHTRMAQRIYQKETVTKEERYVGKKINFSTEYGAGPETLWESLAKEDVHVDFDAVRRGHSLFWSDYAGLAAYVERQESEVRAGRRLHAPTGGYHWGLCDMALIHPKDEEEAIRSCFNATIQSVPPRLMYRVALQIEDEVEIVLQTYDGLLLYVPADAVVDVARRIKDVVAGVTSEPWWGGVLCPADVKAGSSWGELTEVACG